jgi:hypothetical protein
MSQKFPGNGWRKSKNCQSAIASQGTFRNNLRSIAGSIVDSVEEAL